jgi:hypothetical protein
MKALLDAVANILQFVVPALLISWADRPRKQSVCSTQNVRMGDV